MSDMDAVPLLDFTVEMDKRADAVSEVVIDEPDVRLDVYELIGVCVVLAVSV